MYTSSVFPLFYIFYLEEKKYSNMSIFLKTKIPNYIFQWGSKFFLSKQQQNGMDSGVPLEIFKIKTYKV